MKIPNFVKYVMRVRIIAPECYFFRMWKFVLQVICILTLQTQCFVVEIKNKNKIIVSGRSGRSPRCQEGHPWYQEGHSWCQEGHPWCQEQGPAFPHFLIRSVLSSVFPLLFSDRGRDRD